MSRLNELYGLRSRIDEVDYEDAPAFHRIVSEALALLEIADADLASRFNMSRPSVNRWKNGRNAPHPAVRRPVYEFFTKQASRAIDAEEARESRVGRRRSVAAGTR